MNKTNKILIALLVAQAALALITWTAVKNAPEVTERKNLFDFTSADVTGIEIVATQGDEVQPAVGMEKDGDNWVMTTADQYPVLPEKITEWLDTLTATKVEEPIATSSANYSTLNVADDGFDRKVTLTAKGKKLTVYLGRGERSNAHVRIQGKNEVYEAQGLSVWSINSRASNYVNTEYLKLEADKVSKLTVTNSKGAIECIRENGEWTIPGLLPETEEPLKEGELKKVINKDELKRFAEKLIAITLSSPVGKKLDPAYGLSDGAKVVIETEKDGKPHSIELAIGAKVDSDRYVKSSESEFVVKTSNYVVEPATEKAAADFIKEVTPEDAEKAEMPQPMMPQGMGGMGMGMEGMPPGMMMAPPQ